MIPSEELPKMLEGVVKIKLLEDKEVDNVGGGVEELLLLLLCIDSFRYINQKWTSPGIWGGAKNSYTPGAIC